MVLQCDEIRPTCGRCVRSARVCSGYSDGLDLVLRPQNDIVVAHSRRRDNAFSRSKDSTPNRRSTSHSPVSDIAAPIAESKDAHALSFFFSTYVLYHRETQADRGYLELLPYICTNLKSESHLSLALAASSHLLFDKHQLRLRNMENHVSPYHAKALQATRLALHSPSESMTDELLMTICLLGFYEVCQTMELIDQGRMN